MSATPEFDAAVGRVLRKAGQLEDNALRLYARLMRTAHAEVIAAGSRHDQVLQGIVRLADRNLRVEILAGAPATPRIPIEIHARILAAVDGARAVKGDRNEIVHGPMSRVSGDDTVRAFGRVRVVEKRGHPPEIVRPTLWTLHELRDLGDRIGRVTVELFELDLAVWDTEPTE